LSSEQLMSLREHLSELKRRFKIAFLSFVILLVIFLIVPADPSTFISEGYLGFQPIIGFFIGRVKIDLLPAGWQLLVISLNEPLEIYIVASVLFALIFNGPIFAYELIKFISPGLKESERGLIYPFVGATAGLFAFGAVFGYFFLAKFLLAALSPFYLIVGINHPTIDVANFYFIVLLTIGMSGIAFTVPVYVYTLIRFGVVRAASFRKNRLIIWAVTYILCAIITPDGGPLLDVILFVPIIALLEVAVFIGGRARGRYERKKRAEDIASGLLSPDGSTPPAPTEPSTGAPTGIPGPVFPGATVVSAPTTCPYCNYSIAPGTVFCPNCGKAIE
jgi:sec-independent protein translocase protein TatC